MATERATAKDAQYMLINLLPDVCRTPTRKSKPVPYPIVHLFSQSKQCSPNVFFEGKSAYLHEESFVDNVRGDEPGTGKGIVSKTNVEISRSIDRSESVYINGDAMVRTGDESTSIS
ncbi:PAAR-like domain-containing protein [Lampropedia aestuarii]|uniref:PAAR-like domain-containing protein n=1 Tax=Lampropedia aestuarii TaxID=2562762 RepID=UPI002468BC7A|nr:PAAR-like domain-containing protein [Lampropedia aestuarii]MDH5856110.1 DUF4150 domain-containing protein [Lampropedia aestuarii]